MPKLIYCSASPPIPLFSTQQHSSVLKRKYSSVVVVLQSAQLIKFNRIHSNLEFQSQSTGFHSPVPQVSRCVCNYRIPIANHPHNDRQRSADRTGPYGRRLSIACTQVHAKESASIHRLHIAPQSQTTGSVCRSVFVPLAKQSTCKYLSILRWSR